MKNFLRPVMTIIRYVVPPLLLCCSGFLLCMLWYSLMADIHAEGIAGVIPQDTLTPIVSYYQVMFGSLIWLPKIFIFTALISMTLQLAITEIPWYLRFPIFLTNASSIFMAIFVTIPTANRFVANNSTPEIQSQIARDIYQGHIIAISCVAFMVVMQLITVIYLQRKAEKK